MSSHELGVRAARAGVIPGGSFRRLLAAARDGGWRAAELFRERARLLGDAPVGPDGRASELVAGRPFTSKHTVVVAD
ncbi:MAG: hypothetical protein ACRDN0_15795 [Trebonia sp.]